MKKKNKKKRASGRTDTLIGPGSEVEGVLQCEDDLRIDGRFNGSIESQGCVTIGEAAIARSNISAREVIVAGKVYGDVTAENKLTITTTGQMYGDVHAASLIVMEGGLLHGQAGWISRLLLRKPRNPLTPHCPLSVRKQVNPAYGRPPAFEHDICFWPDPAADTIKEPLLIHVIHTAEGALFSSL